MYTYLPVAYAPNAQAAAVWEARLIFPPYAPPTLLMITDTLMMMNTLLTIIIVINIRYLLFGIPSMAATANCPNWAHWFEL